MLEKYTKNIFKKLENIPCLLLPFMLSKQLTIPFQTLNHYQS